MSCSRAGMQVRAQPAPCPVPGLSCPVQAARACLSAWAPWASPWTTLLCTASPMPLRAPLLGPLPPPSHPPRRVASPASRLDLPPQGPLFGPLRAPQATPLRTRHFQVAGRATGLAAATAMPTPLSLATHLMSPPGLGPMAHLLRRGPRLALTGTLPRQRQGSLTLDATGPQAQATRPPTSVMHPDHPARTGLAARMPPTLAPTACPA